MDKSLGPDDFNLNFFKECLEIVSSGVLAFVNEFYHKAKVPKVVSASFLAFILKYPNPQNLNKYMPISLIMSSLYKLLSKLLASRLKNMMKKLILKK